MAANQGLWHCPTCGYGNSSGKFCAKCGSARRSDSDSQSVHIAQHEYEPKSTAENQQNNRTKGLLAVIIVAMAMYFGYGYYVEQQYESYEKDLVNTVEAIRNTVDSMKDLSGDSEADETKHVIAKIDGALSHLDEIKGNFSNATVPDNKKNQRGIIIDFIDRSRDVLSKANVILKNQSFWVIRLDKGVEETMKANVSDFEKAIKDASQIKEIKVRNTNLMEQIALETLEKNVAHYVENKIKKDESAYAGKRREYADRLKKDNQTLRQKEELVFLPSEVVVYGKDIVIRGTFYNGTIDRIMGVQEMMINLTLKKQEEVILSLENYTIRDNSLSNMFISPKASFRHTTELRLPGKAEGIGFFDNFIFHAHDIHWKARKVP